MFINFASLFPNLNPQSNEHLVEAKEPLILACLMISIVPVVLSLWFQSFISLALALYFFCFPLIQPIFIEYLLCARHYSSYWGFSSGQNRQISALTGKIPYWFASIENHGFSLKFTDQEALDWSGDWSLRGRKDSVKMLQVYTGNVPSG